MNTSTISSNSEERMGTAPIFKLMLSMGIPTFVAQLINLLYNIVDRIYIGHIPEVGAASLTGIGLCLPIITLVSAFSVFVGAGGSSNLPSTNRFSAKATGTRHSASCQMA